MQYFHISLNFIKKNKSMVWAVLILSYAYFVNVSPIFLPFPLGSLFDLGPWQSFTLLFSRNFLALLVLVGLSWVNRSDLRQHSIGTALLCLVSAQAMCVYSGIPAMAIVVRLLMSAGLAFAMCALADRLSMVSDGPCSALGWFGFSMGAMHFITDGMSYLFSISIKHMGWLSSLRCSVFFGVVLFFLYMLFRSHSRYEPLVRRPSLSWKTFCQDRMVHTLTFAVVFLVVPVLYLTGEMGLFALHHLEKRPMHAILVTRLFYSSGWLIGLFLWFFLPLQKRLLPYCLTVCAGLMSVTSIITIFLQPITQDISFSLMFVMGFAYSGTLLAFRILRERFSAFDGYHCAVWVFACLCLSGLVVSLIVLVLVVARTVVDGGLHHVNLDAVFHGLMLAAPFTSLLAFLSSLYLSPIKQFKPSEVSDE